MLKSLFLLQNFPKINDFQPRVLYLLKEDVPTGKKFLKRLKFEQFFSLLFCRFATTIARPVDRAG